MYKVILKSLLVLSFSVPALAIPIKPKNKMQRPQQQQTQQVATVSNNDRSAVNTSQQQFIRAPRQDKWINYLMLGMNAGMEYSRLGADIHIKGKYMGTSSSGNANADPASSLGLSLMYARLGRDALGFSAGGTIIQKIENNSGSKGTLGYADSMTLIRPEANILLGHNSGVWGGLGGHINYVTGSDIEGVVEPLGFGLQALVGFVPSRNFGLDIGYFVSIHKLGKDPKNELAMQGMELDEQDSYFAFNQWRLKFTYMF